MELKLFDYDLDKDCIAQSPIEPRDNSKLLCIDKENHSIKDLIFKDIVDLIWKNHVLVFNETKVIKARLKWEIKLASWKVKEVEVFLLSNKSKFEWECSVFPGERLKPWRMIYFHSNNSDKIILEWVVESTTYAWRIIRFNKKWEEFLNAINDIWEIPLPPYISNRETDIERYNTVFAKEIWSAAAPTAWLHFTEDLLKELEKKWVKIEKVLLHVWLWTFKTITSENIKDHIMHSESISIDESTAKRLNDYKKNWKKIIAVWTTVTRTLESFSNQNWVIEYWDKETDIFIYPWYKFRFVDEMITNFHLPKSSLIMLISAFYDREIILETYSYAQKNWYRFFSFWDAMYIRWQQI